MFNGEYKIDADAGRSDIKRLSEAAENLRQARQALVRLQNSADTMTSETTRAISEKSAELQKRIDMLNAQISRASQNIQAAITAYLQFDAAHAGNIQG